MCLQVECRTEVKSAGKMPRRTTSTAELVAISIFFDIHPAILCTSGLLRMYVLRRHQLHSNYLHYINQQS